MISLSAHSELITNTDSRISNFSTPRSHRKHPLLLLACKFILMFLLYHAALGHKAEGEIEIEEEEPEIAVVLSPSQTRKIKKNYVNY